MKIIILGLGYVGLVTAVGLANSGHEITGLDVDMNKVKMLQNENMYIYEHGLEELVKENTKNGRLAFDTLENISCIDSEVVFIAVGTPSQSNGSADLSQLKNAIEHVVDKAKSPLTIVVKSTVPPGTGKKIKEMYLEKASFKHSYVSNPEFLREGQALKDWFYPDRIVIGGDDREATAFISDLYKDIKAPIVISDVTTAEMIKYASNAFLATKISFINEIANLSDLTGANIDGVVQGISHDPRISGSFLRAGIGYGGSCFPKDVRALDFISTINGHSFELLKAVINVNNRQRLIPIQILRREMGLLSGKKIAVLGLAFKPNTDDIREAPSIEIINLLIGEGAAIKAYDPIVDGTEKNFYYQEAVFTKNVWETVNDANAIILTTEWDEFVNLDWFEVYKYTQSPHIIIDGRNVLQPRLINEIGFKYFGIGRSCV
ncbi:UDP-glucose dehydrogenase family protein [Desulfoscipio gibsoniae]|uniref:UDP-glucose 6-dehydrogenase n=1 Tax=Desulfoscipio gibsoniae DSM 7213 TaxID=767817 RepID=R4KHC0_9FIRM|nr:UDP-glucose/GDP-mannose dehydrogenase family protein [Desulfoscipio gibsoniae]AGL01037.1 nucleotide sugar dehydrogenase [Desulfoscipio gibsoniae DSM 7213]